MAGFEQHGFFYGNNFLSTTIGRCRSQFLTSSYGRTRPHIHLHYHRRGCFGTAALAFFWLWNKVKELEKRLNEGNSRFDRMDAELKEINKSLGIIIGKVGHDASP